MSEEEEGEDHEKDLAARPTLVSKTVQLIKDAEAQAIGQHLRSAVFSATCLTLTMQPHCEALIGQSTNWYYKFCYNWEL